MKFKVIFLAGLSEDELIALDTLGKGLNKENKADYFSRFFEDAQDRRAIVIDNTTGRLSYAGSGDAQAAIDAHPEKYVKVVPQFEVKLEAKLKLPFPEEIVENGRRYRLVLE